MQGLTDRQAQVLSYIRSSILDRGYPPTLREIGAHMGIRSTNGVNDHLRALERKGYLTREDMKSRALRPMENGRPMEMARMQDVANELAGGEAAANTVSRDAVTHADILEIPVLGRIAAGQPILADEHVVDTMSVDRSMIRGASGGEIFGLKVQGDSMIEAGILSGDTIFVRKQQTAQRGEIVCALIGDEATVKYYFPERDYVSFKPANGGMAPILVRASDFKPTMLLGIVVGVFRRI